MEAAWKGWFFSAFFNVIHMLSIALVFMFGFQTEGPEWSRNMRTISSRESINANFFSSSQLESTLKWTEVSYLNNLGFFYIFRCKTSKEFALILYQNVLWITDYWIQMILLERDGVTDSFIIHNILSNGIFKGYLTLWYWIPMLRKTSLLFQNVLSNLKFLNPP